MSFSMFQEDLQGVFVLIKATLMKESLMLFTESCRSIEKTEPIDLITLASIRLSILVPNVKQKALLSTM